MFDLVLTMTVGVLLRLGVPLRKIGFIKKTQKNYFLNIQKFIQADKKSYCRHATFVSSDKLLSFLKAQFLVFEEGFCHFLFVFVLCVCLFVHSVFLLPLPEVQCPSFLDIRNPWRKVIERNGLRFELFCSKMV